MKRNNIKSTKVYSKEDGKNITKYSVQVRLRGKKEWIQARAGDEILIFATQEEADKIVSDYHEGVKKSINDKLKEGKVKIKMEKEKQND